MPLSNGLFRESPTVAEGYPNHCRQHTVCAHAHMCHCLCASPPLSDMSPPVWPLNRPGTCPQPMCGGHKTGLGRFSYAPSKVSSPCGALWTARLTVRPARLQDEHRRRMGIFCSLGHLTHVLIGNDPHTHTQDAAIMALYKVLTRLQAGGMGE